LKKIVILSNHHSYTYNFRKEIIQRLIGEGYKVYLVLPYGEKIELLKEMGCEHIDLSLDRRGMNPFKDLKLILGYYKILNEVKPDAVLSYTIKPNIYGGIVCRLKKTPFFPNVTGLGTAVNNDGILHRLLMNLYKIAFKNAPCVFFQNKSNKDFFLDQAISLKKYKIIPGSGINISEFTYQEYPKDDGTIRFLFIGRIMKDKGIEELMDAAQQIKEKYRNIQFDALGFCEDEYKERIEFLQKKNIITFHGVRDNVKEYIEKCNAVIHPTHHEGMSNVLLEASATGRPVLASNIPGCRETFDEEVSGYGFEVRNTSALVNTIEKFIKLPYEEKERMGKFGRIKIEREFDRERVVNAYIDEINNLL